jgi:hypothetical protein
VHQKDKIEDPRVCLGEAGLVEENCRRRWT